ncbi:hypothetical protein EB796_000312 [Bugula neritina]|uniref:F-box domain-containing protein n=1 Tax=Bugula neritina TaxID=10212 RepID=A0A7J7KTG2_BUGNE|nr:hypothetical protein EB796_000312 [Bugula neritina]
MYNAKSSIADYSDRLKQISEFCFDAMFRGIKHQDETCDKPRSSNRTLSGVTANVSNEVNNLPVCLQRRPSSLPKNWRHKFQCDDARNLSASPADFKAQKRLSATQSYVERATGHVQSVPDASPITASGRESTQGMSTQLQGLAFLAPDTIALKIFSYLDPVSLCQASRCCYSWHELSTDSYLWKSLSCRKPYLFSPSLLNSLIIKYTKNDTGEISWRKVFSEQYRISSNWRKGRCFIKEFSGHSEGVSCIQFDDERIVSGSFDTTIKVWNIGSNSILLAQTLTGHSKTVRCLHLSGNRLVSGSKDCTLKVWEMEKKENWSSIACKATMIGHSDAVRSVDVCGERVISGSYDCLIKLWDIKTGACLNTLRGHTAPILCVQSDDDKIISGSADTCIKIWDYSGSCLQTLTGHRDSVACLQFDSKRIISGSFDWTIRVWDINTGEHIRTIDWRTAEGHNRAVRCLQADDQRFLSGSDDKTIKVWNIETGERLVTLRSTGYGITCLQFSDTRIVSGSYDNKVLLWDFTV